MWDYTLSSVTSTMDHYPLSLSLCIYLFQSLVMWNYGDVIVSFCITLTYLSGSEKLCYGWLSGVLLEWAGSICIIFWINVCDIYISKYIIPYPLFQSSRPLFVLLTKQQNILIVWNININMDCGDIGEALLIKP